MEGDRETSIYYRVFESIFIVINLLQKKCLPQAIASSWLYLILTAFGFYTRIHMTT
jgi:hypothetical protein